MWPCTQRPRSVRLITQKPIERTYNKHHHTWSNHSFEGSETRRLHRTTTVIFLLSEKTKDSWYVNITVTNVTRHIRLNVWSSTVNVHHPWLLHYHPTIKGSSPETLLTNTLGPLSDPTCGESWDLGRNTEPHTPLRRMSDDPLGRGSRGLPFTSVVGTPHPHPLRVRGSS